MTLRAVTQRPGMFLGASLLMLAGLLFTDVLVADFGRSSHTHGGPHRLDPGRVIDVSTIVAEPGALVLVYPDTAASPEVVSSYDFYLVESGEGAAFLDNRTPEHVYASVVGLRPEVFDDRVVSVVRPKPPTSDPGPGLDLVWIFHLRPDLQRPSDPEGAEYFEKWVRSQTYGSTATVESAAAMRFHRVAQAAVWVLGAAVVVFGALWVRRLLPPPAPPARDEEAETGLRLLATGGRYLGTLRSLLLGSFLPLLFLAWSSLVLVWNTLADYGGLETAWAQTMKAGLWLILGALLGGWSLLTWRVDRAYRLWRARSPPAFD